MATRPTKGSAERIAESLMPGWKAVETLSGERGKDHRSDGDAEPRKADATMPSLDTLKAKYAGAGSTDKTKAAVKPSKDSARDDADTALVKLQNGPLRKTVAISKSARKVLWSQG